MSHSVQKEIVRVYRGKAPAPEQGCSTCAGLLVVLEELRAEVAALERRRAGLVETYHQTVKRQTELKAEVAALRLTPSAEVRIDALRQSQEEIAVALLRLVDAVDSEEPSEDRYWRSVDLATKRARTVLQSLHRRTRSHPEPSEDQG